MYKGQIGLTRFTDNELSRITMNSMKMFLLCAMRLKGTVVYLTSFETPESSKEDDRA